MIMIDKKIVHDLRNWFTSYVSTFKYDDYNLQQNINLKEDHTRRVCKEIIHIGEQLRLDDNQLHLAEIIALFHDIGRFEQYDLYRTFNDQKSEDHAELGIKILEKHKILKQFDESVRNLILCSIKNHNKPLLPDLENASCLFFSKLIRDADKLDILKILTDYYHRNDRKKNGTIELNLPDNSGISTEVYQALINRQIVDMKYVKNLNDFKLLQTGWIFDINFQPTLNRVEECRYMEMIHDVLPKSQEIEEIFDLVRSVLSTNTT